MDNKGEDHFNLLPDELVIRILSFVTIGNLANRVSLVSKRFRRLSLDPSLWKNLYLKSGRMYGTFGTNYDFVFDPERPEEALKLVDRCTNLRTLTVRNRDNASEIIRRALERNSRLEEIDFYVDDDKESSNADDVLEAIAANGQSVRTLRLKGRIDVDVAETLGRRKGFLQNLTSILIDTNGYGPGDEDIKAVVDCCKRLRFLYFEGGSRCCNPDLTDKGVDYLLTGLRETLEGLCTMSWTEGHYITDRAFGNISRCQRLSWVYLILGGYTSGKTLKSILEVPSLRTLRVTCGNYCDMTIQDYVAAFGNSSKNENLKHLRLDHKILDDKVLTAIAEKCPNLISLSLENCAENITDKGICSILQRCGKLRDLELPAIAKFDFWSERAFENVQAPLERLYYYPVNIREEIVREMLPGVEVCKIWTMRGYYDENCWWEKWFDHRAT